MDQSKCKICGSSALRVYAHTATCSNCGVLLFYPYPDDDSQLLATGMRKDWPREQVLTWYSRSSFLNHTNFTHITRFAMDNRFIGKDLNILDYGGGGGQFALVCKSHFPSAKVFITDISDVSLLPEWSCMNIQIPFADFPRDGTQFDVIFLNDVFEHVSDPRFVLTQLGQKLKAGGLLFIDTPKQFWIYPYAKLISKSLYTNILKGTVSTAHLQIWSKKAFLSVVHDSGLTISCYKETSEYTMPADFYLRNMGITNPLIRILARVFYRNTHWLAKNKIICLLTKASPS